MSPLVPGKPVLVSMMTPWLVDVVTIEAPIGPDWTVVATGVVARVIENDTRVTSDGLLQVQETLLYVLHGTTIAADYRVTRTSDGQRWLAGIPRVRAEAPAIEVPLQGVR